MILLIGFIFQNYREQPASPEVQDEFGLKGEGDTSAALLEIEKRNELEGEGGGGGVKTKYPRSLPSEPVTQYQEPPEPPSEPSGVGANKKVAE